MNARRALAWIFAAALLVPAVAAAQQGCGPETHCPMAAAGPAPCHGASLQADDCCPPAAAVEAVEALPLGLAVAPDSAAVAGAPGLAPAVRHSAGDWRRPVTPLYTLFRSLLI